MGIGHYITKRYQFFWTSLDIKMNECDKTNISFVLFIFLIFSTLGHRQKKSFCGKEIFLEIF